MSQDRHGMPAPSAAELEREAAGLRGQSPLVVVGMLRANLASLRDFKHSCEKELRRVQDRHTHEQASPGRRPRPKIPAQNGRASYLRTVAVAGGLVGRELDGFAFARVRAPTWVDRFCCSS